MSAATASRVGRRRMAMKSDARHKTSPLPELRSPGLWGGAKRRNRGARRPETEEAEADGRSCAFTPQSEMAEDGGGGCGVESGGDGMGSQACGMWARTAAAAAGGIESARGMN
jgi:hypothetical protein